MCIANNIIIVNKRTHYPTKRDIAIHRGSILGNPFSHKSGTLAKYKSPSRETAIDSYRSYLLDEMISNKEINDELDRILKLASEGPIYLVCYCSPLPCHGEVVKQILIKRWERLKLKQN